MCKSHIYASTVIDVSLKTTTHQARSKIKLHKESRNMVLKCDIHFDQNENGVYFAGQLLSGNVTVNLNKTKKLKGSLKKHLRREFYFQNCVSFYVRSNLLAYHRTCSVRMDRATFGWCWKTTSNPNDSLSWSRGLRFDQYLLGTG